MFEGVNRRFGLETIARDAHSEVNEAIPVAVRVRRTEDLDVRAGWISDPHPLLFGVVLHGHLVRLLDRTS